MRQPELFESYARKTDPSTSQAAAAGVNVQAKEAAVLAAMERLGYGATTKEIAQASGLSLWTVTPRMRPLCRKGKVIDSGIRRARQIVWVRLSPTK